MGAGFALMQFEFANPFQFCVKPCDTWRTIRRNRMPRGTNQLAAEIVKLATGRR
jgi:hypothetical protein